MEKPDLLARKRTQGRGDLSLYVGARKSAENVERKQIRSVSPQLVVIVSSRNQQNKRKQMKKLCYTYLQGAEKIEPYPFLPHKLGAEK